MVDQIEQNEEVLRQVLPQTQRQERRVLASLNYKKLKNELKDEEEYSIEGETLMTRHVLSAQVKENVVEQQHGNVFHTRCHVNNKVCILIIDVGSCANVAIALLVEKLQLKTLKHPRPYKLQWLSDNGGSEGACFFFVTGVQVCIP